MPVLEETFPNGEEMYTVTFVFDDNDNEYDLNDFYKSKIEEYEYEGENIEICGFYTITNTGGVGIEFSGDAYRLYFIYE